MIKTCTCFLFLIRYFADNEEFMSSCEPPKANVPLTHFHGSLQRIIIYLGVAGYLIVRCAVSHLPFQTLSWGISRQVAPRNWYEVSWLNESTVGGSLSIGGPLVSQPGTGEQDESHSIQTLRASAWRLVRSLKCFPSLWWEIVQIKPQTLWREELIPRHVP